ncbi:hypothetical protein IW146_002213 [Coemansia sp. RSA 922]|nr:hypothetical protein IW146_002213 [Coemansia sp. RSA 922]
MPKYDVITKRWWFNHNRVAAINFRRIVVSLRETGETPDIFKPSTPLPDTRKKSNADKSELGEPGATMMAKGTVSNKPRSAAKHPCKQPVPAPSKTLDSYFERKSLLPTSNSNSHRRCCCHSPSTNIKAPLRPPSSPQITRGFIESHSK